MKSFVFVSLFILRMLVAVTACDQGEPLSEEVIRAVKKNKEHLEATATSLLEALKKNHFDNILELFNDLKIRDGLDDYSFLLANRIKDVISSNEFQNLPASDKVKLETLKNQLPTSLKNLVFPMKKKYYRIFNARYENDNLDSFFQHLGHYSNEKVHTSLWHLQGGCSCHWLIEKSTSSPGYYRFRNGDGNVLTGTGELDDHLARRELTTLNSGDLGFSLEWFDWKLIPSGEFMIIQSVADASNNTHREYLYSDPKTILCKGSEPKYRGICRKVYTWTGDWHSALHSGIEEKSNLWKIVAWQ